MHQLEVSLNHVQVIQNFCSVLNHFLHIHQSSIKVNMIVINCDNHNFMLGLHHLQLLYDLQLLHLTFFQLLFQLHVKMFLPLELLLQLFVDHFCYVSVICGSELGLEASHELYLLEKLLVHLSFFIIHFVELHHEPVEFLDQFEIFHFGCLKLLCQAIFD